MEINKGGRPRLISDVLDDSNPAYVMWKAGAFDCVLSEKLDVCMTVVTRWRMRNGLECNAKRVRGENDAERMSLYESGLKDAEICDIVGVSKSAIKCWRRRRNLKPN